MAVLYEAQPGYAIQIPDNAGGPLLVDMGGFDAAQVSRSLITQLSIRRGANVQFVHTLQDMIFVYSFGERIGTITVAGVSFVGMCAIRGKTGIEYVLDWYEDNNVGGGGGPIQLLIGGGAGSGVFKGYLVGLEVDIAKPDLRLANFAFQFQTLPRRRR